MVRFVAVVWLAGCGFSAGSESSASDAPGSVAKDAAQRDAAHPDATKSIDAKVFEDSPASTAGSLTVNVTTLGSTDIDLTSEGTTDWAHWGLNGTSSFDHKTGGGSITDIATTPDLSFGGSPATSSWTNGTPQGAMSKTSSGVGDSAGHHLQFTAPAGTVSSTLRLYVGAQEASARLDVSLSDDSAQTQSMTLTNSNGTTNVRYTITYAAASAGQSLTVSWSDTNDFGNPGNAFAALLSATLQ